MSGRRGETVVTVAIVAVFLLVRLTLLSVREPFFDELFTVWMAHRPLAQILPALQLDSGPPLYYFLARIPDVFALRALSLACALASLLLVLTRRSLGDARFLAGGLLAVYPPAALFAVDARAYALCGLFATAGLIAAREKRPAIAAASILAAAYTHWYGALFLPLVLLSGRPRRTVVPFVIACAAFIPGVWLAMHQPAQATAWLERQSPLAALWTFAFAGRYADALFASLPLAVAILSMIVTVVVLVWGTSARNASSLFTEAQELWFVLVPVILCIGFALAGRTVYFPMRFESVTAVPLMLWLGASLSVLQPRMRWTLAGVLAAIGIAAIAAGAIDHASRPIDDYRDVAMVLRQNAKPHEAVVASGYLYLEAVTQLGEGRVRAYPAEQGRHPGWRVSGGSTDPLPADSFLWIGERGAPELAKIRKERTLRVLYANDRAAIARVGESLTAELH